MLDDTSINAKFDDFTKSDGPMERWSDGVTEQTRNRHSGLFRCDGRIQIGVLVHLATLFWFQSRRLFIANLGADSIPI